MNEKLTIEEIKEFHRLFDKITQRATDVANKKNQLNKVYIGSDRHVSDEYVESVIEVYDDEIVFHTVENYEGETSELRYTYEQLIKGE
ncbi:hypothetical protein IEN91_05030 [Bacillus velezensis]|uniref:hypothetical protein n=1 Tax=Bacillus velezensis TaxID=492670 RepID=UPI0018C6C0FF|nr:hypothetical protein [Bacillus velezensis]QPK89804.1 hypothetical protein IEN91_05030 [Bacillus velezensis]